MVEVTELGKFVSDLEPGEPELGALFVMVVVDLNLLVHDSLRSFSCTAFALPIMLFSCNSRVPHFLPDREFVDQEVEVFFLEVVQENHSRLTVKRCPDKSVYKYS